MESYVYGIKKKLEPFSGQASPTLSHSINSLGQNENWYFETSAHI